MNNSCTVQLQKLCRAKVIICLCSSVPCLNWCEPCLFHAWNGRIMQTLWSQGNYSFTATFVHTCMKRGELYLYHAWHIRETDAWNMHGMVDPCTYCALLCMIHEQSMNHISPINRPRCYVKSSTVHNPFWSIPGCTDLPYYAHEQTVCPKTTYIV